MPVDIKQVNSLTLYIITEPSNIPSRAAAYSHVNQERPHKLPQRPTLPRRRAAAMFARAEHGSLTRAPRASASSGQTQSQTAHRHSSRSRSPTRPKPAHRVNHPSTHPLVDLACPTRRSRPPSVATRFIRKRVSARARKGGRGRHYAHRDSRRGGVARGDHD